MTTLVLGITFLVFVFVIGFFIGRSSVYRNHRRKDRYQTQSIELGTESDKRPIVAEEGEEGIDQQNSKQTTSNNISGQTCDKGKHEEKKEEKKTLTTKLIFCFGMSWGRKSDRERFEKLEQEGYTVCGVSDQIRDCVEQWLTAVEHDRFYMSSCFGSWKRRSWSEFKGIIDKWKSTRSNKNTNLEVTMVLDYFWLQTNYYYERYGMNWLTRSRRVKLGECYKMLDRGVDQIFLPVDGGEHNRSGENMLEMLEKFNEASDSTKLVNLERVELDDNPLYVASNNISDEEYHEADRSSNKDAVRFYLPTSEPFVRITRK